jgi:hypothetical protein
MQKVTIMSHGEVQGKILEMDNKEGSDGAVTGDDDSANPSGNPKMASMKDAVSKDGQGNVKSKYD